MVSFCIQLHKEAFLSFLNTGNINIFFKMKTKYFLFASIALSSLIGCKEIEAPHTYGPVPTEAQLKWQELEFYAFIHFSLNSFTDIEWGIWG